jgi:hypothetical protein
MVARAENRHRGKYRATVCRICSRRCFICKYACHIQSRSVSCYQVDRSVQRIDSGDTTRKNTISVLFTELRSGMQVNIIDKITAEVAEWKGIPDGVRKSATESLWQGITEQLNVFKHTLLRAKLVSLRTNTTMHSVCQRVQNKHGCLLNFTECSALLRDNSSLFDHCLESSIADHNVHDAMFLMTIRLSNIKAEFTHA